MTRPGTQLLRELDVTVVVPLYKEEENIDPAVAELLGVLDGLAESAEVILVDDGSPDRTGDLAVDWSLRDERVKVLRFRRNFGQTAAIQAGFDHARGRVVVLMDGDQQNDPGDIPLLLATMADGYDVVSGWRKNRRDRALSRKLPSKIANAMISRITGTRLHDYGCTLKAYDADVVEHLHLYGELHRFIPALAGQAGARVAEVAVNHRARTRGKSKYGIGRTPRVLLDLITVQFLLRYVAKPMQLFGKWGLLSFAAGFLMILALVGEKLSGQAIANRPLLILGSMATLLGALLFCTGLLGELLTRIYHEVGGRDPYVLRRDLRLRSITDAFREPTRDTAVPSGARVRPTTIDLRSGDPAYSTESAT
jgi:glycosyltransferase involved in cell wall biosynthesis